ncbi:MAG: type II toxin-antitoxin system CcdA family antitoxin [Acidobacteria bacterium]|jgi:post-segregation antitoxin (ccd killing protein)|nr:type II toxin-antitoxin system CcdA family antitoxin [Acidobacteriota bacterium]
MPSIVRNNGQSYFVTTCVLPSEIHDKARSLGINVSETLREALIKKIESEVSLR